MRAGGGKQKGSQWERDVCKALSLAVTGGKRYDGFWRTAMSGGRATVKGTDVRQAGDITAVAAECHFVTDRYVIECKFVKDLNLAGFLLFNTGLLAGFWRKLQDEAAKHGKLPLLIVKQNQMLPLAIFNDSGYPVVADCHSTVARASVVRFDRLLKSPFFRMVASRA